VTAMSQYLEVSRSGYYAWVGRLEQADRDSAGMAAVEAAYQRSHRTYAIGGLQTGCSAGQRPT
jgi:hypothetical protein